MILHLHPPPPPPLPLAVAYTPYMRGALSRPSLFLSLSHIQRLMREGVNGVIPIPLPLVSHIFVHFFRPLFPFPPNLLPSLFGFTLPLSLIMCSGACMSVWTQVFFLSLFCFSSLAWLSYRHLELAQRDSLSTPLSSHSLVVPFLFHSPGAMIDQVNPLT